MPVPATRNSERIQRGAGQQFRGADLHIHSFGEDGSSDAQDSTMTPENIVDTAIAERLDLIAITDHTQIANIRPALIC